MQAIILAAGMGKRLGELTRDNTKCMVKVNGVSLIERMLLQISGHNISRVVIVIGYEGNKLKDYIEKLELSIPIEYIENSVYNKTNNIYSLYLARDLLSEDDTILFESDIIFEDAVLSSLIEDKRPTLALVAKYESWMDGTCLKLDDEDNIVEFVSKNRFQFDESNNYFKTVNLYKFSRHFSVKYYIPFLKAYIKALGDNEYYEQVLKVITMLDSQEIKAKRLKESYKWYEIDDIQDLDIASSMFSKEDERLGLISKRYGGYWRYSRLLDFCYLVNPYFPTKHLKDEMRASFDTLLTKYPSGMEVNSLLASNIFGINTTNIVVGNGAAELIKSLMQYLEGVTAYIKPTFEEYPNRLSNKNIFYTPCNDNFSYTAEDIKNFITDERNKGVEIDNFILINPDNPSGNYIGYNDLTGLISWCHSHRIKIIVDESFADFSDENDNTLIRSEMLEEYKELYVIKSISKSYGVPGLRLGVLASCDIEAVDYIKKDVSIWNINSFAEFYMQIMCKYKSEYIGALESFRKERKRFGERLSEISGIRLLPSQANYFMLELLGDMSADKLSNRLLSDYNILIKNLKAKINQGEYLRISVRNREDNDKLINALREIMDSECFNGSLN